MAESSPGDDAPVYPPLEGPFAPPNAGFHETYERRVRELVAELGQRRPVIVLREDELTLLEGGRVHVEVVKPDAYHRNKSLAHLAFGLQLCLGDEPAGPLRPVVRDELLAKRAQLEGVAADLGPLAPEERAVGQALLADARALIDRTLADDALDPEALGAFERAMAPRVLEQARFAARLEIDALHAVVTRWRTELGERWDDVHVVECASHQPRYRETARQYFARVLHEPVGPDAEFEDRLLYAESAQGLEQALDLLARHLLDRRAARRIFGDPRRLQEDMMADAATGYLDQLRPEQA